VSYSIDRYSSIARSLNFVSDELNWRIDLADVLEKYKTLYPDDPLGAELNVLRLLPFRTACTCGQQLGIEFTNTAYALFPDSVQPCSLYASTCVTCSRTYRVSSIFLPAEKVSIVTTESIRASFFHLSCDRFVFSQQVLLCFSSLLVDGHITFLGYAAALVSTIARLRPSCPTNKQLINQETRISRALQSHWLYFELAHFIFMTSNEVEIRFPSTASSGEMF
jgi:hypothetical protein